ncbi:MAG TPA: prepilin-type N-terminal cleavage/methylation domain-containing protein [Pyrinomonadaceae bacterium]|nr:prepilin-type N-terminal cleavage/methylation domain-containing protein [Pyrinomonadaceae bacterium]
MTIERRRRVAVRDGASAERGFTLIETAIALVIMMIAGFGAISLFIFSINFNAGASDRARAFAIAQQRMEMLRATSYANLVATTANPAPEQVTVGSNQANGGADQRTFNVQTIITDGMVISGTPRRKTITVTVVPLGAARFSAGAVTLVTQRASTLDGPN